MDRDSDGEDDVLWNDEDMALMTVVQVVVNNNMMALYSSLVARHEQDVSETIEDILRPNQDYRHLPRNTKAIFRHDEALKCIQRDYFGIPGDLTTPIFKNKSFEMMFRLSRSRVQRIFDDIMQTNHPFYVSNVDATGKKGASLEAKVLLPLKTFAYGVAPHAFSDYFQMSKPLAGKCCEEFPEIMHRLYSEEYLRIPDACDIKDIVNLHEKVHGVQGMLGSLDCMHTGWKNCPKAWQASFKSGKESGGPTVVLEALADYHLWFWHASFGYAGSLNDLNILNLSPLLESLVDGSFVELEKSANVVPFRVAGESFQRLFALVDGIYPPYSRFVKAIQLPVTESEKYFTAWQEGARKDIERAFGVLQARFQVMSRPFHGHSLQKISKIVSACLIMHNMCIADRVMDGNVYAVYDPMYNGDDVDDERRILEEDLLRIEENNNRDDDDDLVPAGTRGRARIGLANTDNEFVQQHMVARQTHWRGLNDRNEHARLHSALLRSKGGREY